MTASRTLNNSLGLSESERRLSKLRQSDPENPTFDEKLAATIQGDQKAGNEGEQLRLARRAYDQALHATASRLWGEAFETNPKLKNDRQLQYPFHAAQSASLGGCGAAKDDLSLDESARAKLRGQAREWLKGVDDVSRSTKSKPSNGQGAAIEYRRTP